MRSADPGHPARRQAPRSRNAATLALILLAGAWVASTVAAAATTEAGIPAAPTRFVTDNAGFLSVTARAELDARLQSFEAASGHQVLLWIGHTTGNAPIEDWAARAFAAWRVGRKGLDDGIVLFIMGNDRKLRIEVGYGLEDRLPDVRAATIIRERIVPRLRAGDRDGAARAGIDAILGAVGGAEGDSRAGGPTYGPDHPQGVRGPSLGWGEWAVLVLFALVLIGFLITHPGLAILLLTHLASSRGHGGRRGGFGGGGGFGGFSGGGFSGGGGRSGGGGATGSW